MSVKLLAGCAADNDSVGVTACHPRLSRRQDSCPKVKGICCSPTADHSFRLLFDGQPGDSVLCAVTGRYWPVIMPCHDQNVRNTCEA